MDAAAVLCLYSRVDELLEYLVCFATLCRQVHGQWVAHLCEVGEESSSGEVG